VTPAILVAIKFFTLALSLFMFWGFTNNANPAVAPDDFTIFADFFYAASYFHNYSR